MASTQNSNQNSTQNSSLNEHQNSASTQNQSTTQHEQQNTTGATNSWLTSMPGLNQIVQKVTQEVNNQTVQPYQLAGLNQTQQAALDALSKGRNTDQLNSLLSQYQNQASGFTNYGDQQTQINNLAQGYYQGDLVKQNKADLQTDLSRQLAGQEATLNQQAVGTNNMGSSRAGVAQGVMERGAQENYAKGAASIENDARNSAYNMAYQQYQQGQSNLNTNLGQQTALAGNLMNVGQQDAQTAFNAGQVQQTASQNALDVARQNALMNQSSSLQALNQYLPAFNSLAGYGTNTTGSATGTSTGTGSLNGNTNTTGGQTGTTTGTTNFTGNASGEGTNWGALGAGLAGQATGSILQPVAQAAGNWLANLL